MINLSCSAAAMATSAVVRAAQLLLSDLEHGRRIDAAGTLRAAMETAVGASDAGGAWHWKAAYDACEAATVLFLRKCASFMRAKAAWPASMLSMLTKVASLIPTHTYRSELSRLRQGTPIRLSEGILFTTYATLRSDERGEKLSRVRQIVEWLGPDFGGVVVFDESHAMQNAAGGKGERGDQAASQQGRAGLRLQHALPNARVVYVSATGATISAMPSGLVSGAVKISRSRGVPNSSRRSKRVASQLWRCWRATSRPSASMRRALLPTKASNTN
jgi:P-loop containing NTP hydrolase pore-1